MNGKTNKTKNFSKIPKEFTANLPFLEFTSNRKVLIDGSEGILEYQENIIRVNTGRLIVVIHGRGLYIKCMTATSLTVCGYISGVEFLR